MNKHDFEIYLKNTLRAIQQEYLKAYPDGEYLNMIIDKYSNGDGNDDGDWDVYIRSASNRYWDEDKDFPIEIHFEYDAIKNEKYWKCFPDGDDSEGPVEIVRR